MSLPNWVRRPSALTAATAPIMIGLVMNLATSTVQVTGVWTWVVWFAMAVLVGVAVLTERAHSRRIGHADTPAETERPHLARRSWPALTTALRKPLVAALVGISTTLAVAMFFVVSCVPGSNVAHGPEIAPGSARDISCEIGHGPLTLAISGRQGSPGFAMSPTVARIVREATDHGEQIGPATFVNVDGKPSVVGQTRATSLPLNSDAAESQTERSIQAVAEEGAKIRARAPEVDVLGALDTAARANGSGRSGTIILFDSGLSTAGGVAFDQKTAIDVAADDMVRYLESSGYMPDLSGMTVLFVGLGETGAPQPSLRPAQRRHLAIVWTKIAQAAGAKCVEAIDEVGHPQPPHDVPAVRLVFVPPPPAVRQPGTGTSIVLSASSELQFHDDTAKFEDEVAATQSLSPVLRLIAANPDRSVRVTGTTSNYGSKDSQRQLSTARAQAVADLLVELGVPEGRITVKGVGSDFAEYVPDTEPDGRVLPGLAQQNRTIRIDLVAE